MSTLLPPAPFRKSRLNGVSRIAANRWSADVRLSSKKVIRIGCFSSPEAAAAAYDEAALRLLGPGTLNSKDLDATAKPVVDGETTRIPVNSGRHFIIDTDCLDLVSQFYWALNHNSLTGTRKGRRVNLHFLLLGKTPPRKAVIHLNGDPLDYRLSNMIFASRHLLLGSRPKRPGTLGSGFKGVHREASAWTALLAGKYLGAFRTEVAAAIAYDNAARRRYGIFAAINFPREGELSCNPVLPSNTPERIAA